MNPLDRVVRWGNVYAGKSRKKEKCTILQELGGRCQVRFEDGQTAILPRMALTRTGAAGQGRPRKPLTQTSEGETV